LPQKQASPHRRLRSAHKTITDNLQPLMLMCYTVRQNILIHSVNSPRNKKVIWFFFYWISHCAKY
jgi:hypothetical protein